MYISELFQYLTVYVIYVLISLIGHYLLNAVSREITDEVDRDFSNPSIHR